MTDLAREVSRQSGRAVVSKNLSGAEHEKTPVGMGLPSPIDVALGVARALERVGVGYFLGGSMASSVQGEPRSTNDIDFVVELEAQHVSAFELALGSEFDVDGQSLRDAAFQKTSWNIFHVPSMTKIDLFIRRPGDFDDSEFSRRKPIEI